MSFDIAQPLKHLVRAEIPALLAMSVACLAALTALLRDAHASETSPCSKVQFEGQAFTSCVADPERDRIRLFLTRPDGRLYGALSALPEDGLLFATNAGMYSPTYAPVGLYVEDGKTLGALNTVVSGYGNFHIQPNGVFWVKDGKAAVTTTAAFAKLTPDVDIATQSGPMLVIDGAVNSRFFEDGTSRYVRNGIGVDGKGRVIVAISEEPVSFGRFGRLFRDALRCHNALYLDGSVSRLRIKGEARDNSGRTLGPLLGVYAKAAP